MNIKNHRYNHKTISICRQIELSISNCRKKKLLLAIFFHQFDFSNENLNFFTRRGGRFKSRWDRFFYIVRNTGLQACRKNKSIVRREIFFVTKSIVYAILIFHTNSGAANLRIEGLFLMTIKCQFPLMEEQEHKRSYKKIEKRKQTLRNLSRTMTFF